MFLRFFGLNEDPFGVTPEPRFLYHSNTHREALASLRYGFQSNRGFTALIASPGLGKTTLLYRFLDDIRHSARSVFLFDVDSECSPRELITSILRDLGVTPDPTAWGMHEQLNKVLVEEARAGRTVVIIIDEAQNLSEAALETVRLLSNFETASAKLIHIVLSGQPQLLDKLVQPSLIQLRQRITTFCRLDALSAEEASHYIQHRLTLAGYSGKALFTDEAVRLISTASRGIPRTINNLCFNALSICRALNKEQVTGNMVEEAIADLQMSPVSKQEVTPELRLSFGEPAPDSETRGIPGGMKRRTLAAAAALLCAAVVGVLGYSAGLHREVRSAPSASTPDVKVVPAPVSVADDGKSSQLQIAAADAKVQRFKVKVERHQTLRDISMQYLGEFNEKRLRQIRALNPSLKNPDRVWVGQSIWLPGPPPSNVAKTELTSTEARSLP